MPQTDRRLMLVAEGSLRRPISPSPGFAELSHGDYPTVLRAMIGRATDSPALIEASGTDDTVAGVLVALQPLSARGHQPRISDPPLTSIIVPLIQRPSSDSRSATTPA